MIFQYGENIYCISFLLPIGKLIWPEVFEHSMSLVAGLLLMCEIWDSFELFGPFTSWRKMNEWSEKYWKVFIVALICQARTRIWTGQISELLMSIGGNHPIFLISEQDVKLWESKLLKFLEWSCVDNKSLKSIPSLELLRESDLVRWIVLLI